MGRNSDSPDSQREDPTQAGQVRETVPSLRVRMFGWADHWCHRLVDLISALHEGFWLGRLNADDLNSVTALHFNQSQLYASAEHNLSGFQPWEKSALAYFRPASRILVAGAGAGREVLALRKAGYETDGFECNLSLVRASEAIFKQVGDSEPVLFSPPDVVPQGAQIYEGLIAGWSVYTHIPTRARRIRFLQSLRQRAVAGSPVLLSFFARRDGSRYEKLVWRTSAFSRMLPGGRKEPPELGDRLDWKRYSHSFTEEELKSELTEAGFTLARFQTEGKNAHAVGIVT